MGESAKSKKAFCADDLRRQILTQQLEPGSYLDENRISGSYNISRPPLREVLRELAGQGYVVLHENRGTQVAPMTHKTLRSFFVAAPMIYAAVTRLAAENAKPAQIMQLKDTQLLFRAAIRDGNTTERALMNERFHAIIGEMADNDYLMPSLQRLLIDHTRIGMTFFNPRNAELAENRSLAADQHDQFIALIEMGDVDGASELAIAHWELSRTEFESFVTPRGMEFPLGTLPDRRKERGAS